MAPNDLTNAIEQSHAALGAILKGDPSVYQALYSLADDVTLGNPFGPYVRGRQKVEATLAGAASHYRDGEVTDVELIAKYVSDTLACFVEVERGRSKVGGAEEVLPVAVRVTSLFRLESGTWKLVHRHADPITTPRPAVSVISRQHGERRSRRYSTLHKRGLTRQSTGRTTVSFAFFRAPVISNVRDDPNVCFSAVRMTAQGRGETVASRKSRLKYLVPSTAH